MFAVAMLSVTVLTGLQLCVVLLVLTPSSISSTRTGAVERQQWKKYEQHQYQDVQPQNPVESQPLPDEVVDKSSISPPQQFAEVDSRWHQSPSSSSSLSAAVTYVDDSLTDTQQSISSGPGHVDSATPDQRRRRSATLSQDDSEAGDEVEDENEIVAEENLVDYGEPRTSESKIAAWNKRPRYYRQSGDGGTVRDWRTNMMRVWGKRSAPSAASSLWSGIPLKYHNGKISRG